MNITESKLLLNVKGKTLLEVNEAIGFKNFVFIEESTGEYYNISIAKNTTLTESRNGEVFYTIKKNGKDIIKEDIYNVFPTTFINKMLGLVVESVDTLKDKLRDSEIDSESLEDLVGQLTDDDISDSFIRNLDRKLLKSGDKTENIKKYIQKYIDSIKSREDSKSDPSDDFGIDDDFLYGGIEPEQSKIGRKQFKKELLPLQVELLKLQEHVKETSTPVAVVMEGRDSAGKGSTIKKMTEYLDPKYFKVVALGIPSDEERKDWFGRYEKYIEPGKMTFFDRSWYNRGIVEPVMGYGSEEEYFDFMNTVNDFEKSLVDRGVKLFKFWLSITSETQKKRFDLRKNSPLKYWKFSPNDEKSIDKWDSYTEYKEKVLTQTKEAMPWTVVDSNDKRVGTLNLLRHVLKNIDYKDKDESKIGGKYPEVTTTVDEVSDTLNESRLINEEFDHHNSEEIIDYITDTLTNIGYRPRHVVDYSDKDEYNDFGFVMIIDGDLETLYIRVSNNGDITIIDDEGDYFDMGNMDSPETFDRLLSKYIYDMEHFSAMISEDEVKEFFLATHNMIVENGKTTFVNNSTFETVGFIDRKTNVYNIDESIGYITPSKLKLIDEEEEVKRLLK